MRSACKVKNWIVRLARLVWVIWYLERSIRGRNRWNSFRSSSHLAFEPSSLLAFIQLTHRLIQSSTPCESHAPYITSTQSSCLLVACEPGQDQDHWRSFMCWSAFFSPSLPPYTLLKTAGKLSCAITPVGALAQIWKYGVLDDFVKFCIWVHHTRWNIYWKLCSSLGICDVLSQICGHIFGNLVSWTTFKNLLSEYIIQDETSIKKLCSSLRICDALS